ncbi:MAG: N-acetyltransferase family protein [Clostridia bacterium]
MRFHERLGYQMVGTFHQCGYKFETWYHVVWMKKCIEYLKYRNNEK